jgi:hypothetical protein
MFGLTPTDATDDGHGTSPKVRLFCLCSPLLPEKGRQYNCTRTVQMRTRSYFIGGPLSSQKRVRSLYITRTFQVAILFVIPSPPRKGSEVYITGALSTGIGRTFVDPLHVGLVLSRQGVQLRRTHF